MTTTEAYEATASRRRRPSRRTIVALGVVVAAVVAIAVYTIVTQVHRHRLDAQYGPLDEGPAWGPVADGLDRFRGEDPLRIKGPTGTVASYVRTVRNNGSHAVTVTAVDRNEFVTSVGWAPFDGTFVGVRSLKDVRAFPAVIPAKGFIFVVTTLRKPDCRNLVPPGGGSDPTQSMTVHWRSLLDDHVTEIDFHDTEPYFSIC